MSNADVLSPLAEKYLRLHLCPEIGGVRFRNLIEAFGSIEAVLDAGPVDLTSVNQIGRKTADAIREGLATVDVAAEIERARREGVRICCIDDPDYPPLLKHIADPPPCIYIAGRFAPEDRLALGIVGSRRCTRYGAEQAERFAALAAQAGLTVISGMARGIDTAAHRGALIADGRTIAVLGCGLCHIYPNDGHEVAHRIMERGAVISALPMDVAPDASNFPPRNRIIAGMSLGVLVVEAAQRSGALITARLASEYDREVFAVPGLVTSPSSQGCHDLIKRSAAKLVTHFEDILDELGPARDVLRSPEAAPPEDPPARVEIKINDVERDVLAAMNDMAMAIEDICQRCHVPPARIAGLLVDLQLKGAVRRVDGDLFESTGRAKI